jgi:hypothetical protein
MNQRVYSGGADSQPNTASRAVDQPARAPKAELVRQRGRRFETCAAAARGPVVHALSRSTAAAPAKAPPRPFSARETPAGLFRIYCQRLPSANARSLITPCI